MLALIKRLFHRHEWLMVGRATAKVTKSLGTREWKESGIVFLEACETCGKERAYYTNGIDRSDVCPRFVRARMQPVIDPRD